MEFYNFYQLGLLFMSWSENVKTYFTGGVIIGVVIWLALFFLQGAGLYVMAKRRGMPKRALAFVPFANIYYLGKIVGECGFFGQKMKRAGLYAMIAQILSVLCSCAYVLSEWYLHFNHGLPVVVQEGIFSTPYWPDLTGFSLVVYKTYVYGLWLLSIFGLIAEILLIVLMVGLYKKYAPANYRLLGVFAFMIPYVRYISIFVLRNRAAIDYEEYMRRQYEAYARYRQQYYGNPYGMPPTQNPPPPSQEDPFDEFSSNKGNSGKPSSNEKDTDEFF